MQTSRLKIILLLFLITLFGLGLRLYTASQVFPAQSDAGHFVQYGVAYAHGLIPNISGFWAILPQWVVVWAVRAGLDPLKTLQMFTVFCGAIIVLCTGGLAWGLTKRPWVGLGSALLVAVNFPLIAISATGLSEPSYLACLLAGSAVWIWGINRERKLLVWLGASVIALALFFKPYETYIFFAICMFVVLVKGVLDRQVRRSMVMFIVSLAAFTPVWTAYFAYSTSLGIEKSSQTKVYNIIYGVTGFDSKVNRSSFSGSEDHPINREIRLLEENGPLWYLWHRKAEFARAYPVNLAEALRVMNDQVFYGAFRLGFAWFMLLAIACFVVLVKSKSIIEFTIPLLMAMAVPMAISLGMVNERWLVQCIPFMAILLIGALAGMSPLNRNTKIMAVLLVMVYATVNARTSIVYTGDQWRQRHIQPVADYLRTIASEDDILMTFGPSFPVAFFRTNTMNFVEIPYGTIEQTAMYASDKKVKFIVFSRERYKDYPLLQADPGISGWPPEWELVTNKVFQVSTRYGLQTDTYTIIRTGEGLK